MSEQARRAQVARCGGVVVSVTVQDGEARAIVKLRNRGEMNEARRELVRQGWHVISHGVTLTATARV